MKFKIVVPTYNTKDWIARCIHSIASQTYQDYECVIIDDASDDGTGQVIDEYVANLPNKEKFKIVHNENNVKALTNIVNGFNLLAAKDDPESVLMAIDGDDFLFSPFVLEIVKQAYEQTGCLLSYGNHVHYPTGGKSNCEQIPKQVYEENAFRKYKFVTSHLRTFKSKLWYSIRDEDLRDDDGNYYSVGWDVAFMMPMLEMSAERTLFIPNVLYCYNRFNPISDDVIRQSDQRRVEMKIRNSKPYERIQF